MAFLGSEVACWAAPEDDEVTCVPASGGRATVVVKDLGSAARKEIPRVPVALTAAAQSPPGMSAQVLNIATSPLAVAHHCTGPQAVHGSQS